MNTIPSNLEQQIQGLLQEYLDKARYVGFAVGVVNALDGATPPAGAVYYYGGLTFQDDPPKAVPPGDQTPWQVGSITKTYRATLLALCSRLIPAGLFNVPIYPYIEAYLPQKPKSSNLALITFLQLANHTSGLPSSGGPHHGPLSAEDMFRQLTEVDISEPGKTYLYSDLGYAILLASLASLGGPVNPVSNLTEVSSIMQQTGILDPLQLTSTKIYTPALLSSLPFGYTRDWELVRTPYMNYPAYGGGIVTTAPDFLTWLEYNMGLLPGSGLSSGLLDLLRVPSFTGIEGSPVTTPGWFVHMDEYGSTYQKDGGYPDYQTLIAYDLLSGCGAFLLGNCHYNSRSIMRQILSTLAAGTRTSGTEARSAAAARLRELFPAQEPAAVLR